MCYMKKYFKILCPKVNIFSFTFSLHRIWNPIVYEGALLGVCSWEGGVRGNEQKENPNCKAIIKASQRTCGNLSPHQHFIEILGEPLGVGCLQGVGVNLGEVASFSREQRGHGGSPATRQCFQQLQNECLHAEGAAKWHCRWTGVGGVEVL